MHIRHLQRYGTGPWSGLRRVAIVALSLQSLLWCCWVGTASADPNRASLIRVSTVKAVASHSYASERTYAGTIVAGRASELGFRFSGQLASIEVDIGSAVNQGDLLAALNIASRQATLAEAEAKAAVAQANVAALDAETDLAQQTEQRFANLRETSHVSAQQYDERRLALQAKQARRKVAIASHRAALAQIQAAKVALAEAHIRAPYAGVVQARYADEGAQISPGQAVLRLVETENKEAHIGLPEQLAVNLQADASHQLHWADQSFPATLKTVLPEVDARNRTLTAVYRLANDHSARLPIGAVVELAVSSEVTEDGYWVPLTALTESDRGLWGVYVVTPSEVVERRLVEILHSEDTQAFVRGTLRPGDQIVATGVQRLVPGQRVNSASKQAG
ncbi:MAG: efflux RND transporter periplasmic adaptor subunit [Pseudomonadales bacterium]